MNTCHTNYSGYFSTCLPQRLVERLAQLQLKGASTIPGSIYIYDLVDQRTLCATCSVATMLGYTSESTQAMELDGLASLIHPDDLHLVSDHYQRFTTLQTGKVITTNYRMRRADGVWCWLRSQETSLVQAIAGFPLQILGIVQINTQRVVPSLEDLLRQINFAHNLN